MSQVQSNPAVTSPIRGAFGDEGGNGDTEGQEFRGRTWGKFTLTLQVRSEWGSLLKKLGYGEGVESWSDEKCQTFGEYPVRVKTFGRTLEKLPTSVPSVWKHKGSITKKFSGQRLVLMLPSVQITQRGLYNFIFYFWSNVFCEDPVDPLILHL